MKLTLGKKLGLGFGAILALMVVSAVMSYVKSADIKRTPVAVLDVRVPSLECAGRLQRDLNQTASKARQAMLAGGDARRRTDAQKLLDDSWKAIDEDVARLNELEPHWILQANRDRLAEMKRQLPQLRELEYQGIKESARAEPDALAKAGNNFSDKAIPVNNAIKGSLGDMADSFEKLLKENQESLVAENRSMMVTLAVTSLLALAIGIFVAIFLSRSISGASHSILKQAEAIAAGDLTGDDLQVRSQDELGELTIAINQMSGSLKRMILAISGNSRDVSSASEELSSTSQQITANSEETSAQANVVSNAAQQVSQNLQTVATGAEQMGVSIKEIAKNASEAAKIATSAVKVAETTTATVSKLGESSNEIG